VISETPQWGEGSVDQNKSKSIYEDGLDKTLANYRPLTPVDFLRWAARVYPTKTAIIHGDRRYTYAEFYDRVRRLASSLTKRGIGVGDTVSVMAPNVPEALEAHYGVPMIGAVLNSLNIRQDSQAVSFILNHGEAKVLITDREFSPVIKEALRGVDARPLIIDIDDALAEGGELIGEMDYEAFLAGGDPDFAWSPPEDEWHAISLLYTSGTTGDPKGVVYHHRGAYLNAMGNALVMRLNPATVYMWTLPMFHCDGWTFTWAVTAVGGTHVCLRKVDPALIFSMIKEHRVTHMCGAPVVLGALIHAPDEVKVKFDHTVEIATGGASPPAPVIVAMDRMGFRVIHLYGLTETYGPATYCAWQEDWDGLDMPGQAGKMARQGVPYPTLGDLIVADPETLEPVPADGETIGEILMQSNTVMRGYLKNPAATMKAMVGGWLRSGDLAVMHADGYVEMKDRSKDIVISGGENISSIEVESVLYEHPAVMEVAVVAKADKKWGETPCAFVTLKPGANNIGADDIIAFCRDHMAHFKCPRHVVFGPLPKTSTGKIQKFLLREQAKEA